MRARNRVRHAGNGANAIGPSGWTYLRYWSEGWIAHRLKAADELRLPLEYNGTAISIQGPDNSFGCGCRHQQRWKAILGSLCANCSYWSGRTARDLRGCRRQCVARSRTRRQCPCGRIPPDDFAATVVGRGPNRHQSGVRRSGSEALLATGGSGPGLLLDRRCSPRHTSIVHPS